VGYARLQWLVDKLSRQNTWAVTDFYPRNCAAHCRVKRYKSCATVQWDEETIGSRMINKATDRLKLLALFWKLDVPGRQGWWQCPLHLKSFNNTLFSLTLTLPQIALAPTFSRLILLKIETASLTRVSTLVHLDPRTTPSTTRLHTRVSP